MHCQLWDFNEEKQVYSITGHTECKDSVGKHSKSLDQNKTYNKRSCKSALKAIQLVEIWISLVQNNTFGALIAYLWLELA
jgi:hypothetical protein